MSTPQGPAADRYLHDLEARLAGLVESAMDAIITVDRNQGIVLFNAAAERMFGCRRIDVIGTPLAGLIPERFRAAHCGHVERFGAGDVESRRMGGERIVIGLRRSGEEFPIDASISKVAESDGIFYTVILRDVTERVRAQAEIRHSREELRELGIAAHSTREHEKTRIARELHDELGGALTMLRMDIAWCKEKLPRDPAAVAARLERMEELLKSTALSTRRMAADLRPMMLDDLGLPDALEWLVGDFNQRIGMQCELTLPESMPTLPPAHSTAIFRIVQESLSNIAKHALATRAEVAIEQDGRVMSVRISDDGVGFTPQQPRKSDAYGLLGLRERASLLNGEARVVSAPGKGTQVEVWLPIGGPTP